MRFSIILKIEIFQLFKALHSTCSFRYHRLQNSREIVGYFASDVGKKV